MSAPTHCRCGRRLRFLNEGSTRANCEGCGFLPDRCTCESLPIEGER